MSRKPLVLVVDDVLENVTVLGETLANSCRVQFASSGQECLELVAQQVPDLILLDVMMPGLCGYEVFSQLQMDDALSKIPVIFVTAKNDPQSEAEAIHAGAADFLHKPINPEVVRARVKMQLELANYRRELEEKVLRRTQELAMARIDAESAQAVVTRFMKNVSHEMRTPMHGILGLAQVLKDKLANIDQPKLESFAEMLLQSAQRMNQLVESMLQIAEQNYAEMSQISADSLCAIDLAKMLTECIVAHERHAEQRQQALVLDSSLPRCELRGDPLRLRQVFDALIGNALRYSPESSLVRIQIGTPTSRPDCYSVQVIDAGCGIPEKEASAIFEPFYESSRTSTGAGGTGLGLPLCKAIVKRHKGSITVRNRPEGGSIFEVILPKEYLGQ